MKKLIIILIFVTLTLGIIITAEVVKGKEGVTIYQIRDLIAKEKLDCSKGCDFQIEKVGETYEILSVKDKLTKDVIFDSED